MALDGQTDLDNTPAHQNDANSFDQPEDEAGQVGDDGDGITGKSTGGENNRKQRQDGEDAVDALDSALGVNIGGFHVGSSLSSWDSSSSLERMV